MLLFGALSGASAEAVVYPMEVIRRRMQVQAASASSAGQLLAYYIKSYHVILFVLYCVMLYCIILYYHKPVLLSQHFGASTSPALRR